MHDSVYQGILLGDSEATVQGVEQALNEGVAPDLILNRQMIPAMEEVGRLYESQHYFIPEMMISARAMKRALATIEPGLTRGKVEPIGRYLIGSVQGDLHDIGKNLVAIMLEGVGFEVIDLGVDISPEKFVSSLRQRTPHFLGMSSLLTTTLPSLEKTIRVVEDAGLREELCIMVGGAPVNQELAARIGADIYAADAASAARKARTYLLSVRQRGS